MTDTILEEHEQDVEDFFLSSGERLNSALTSLSKKHYPPQAEKSARTFSTREVAKILGVGETKLKKVPDEIYTSLVRDDRSFRRYSLVNIQEARQYMAQDETWGHLVQNRRAGEHAQIITVTNQKGGCAKTTTSVHLAQYLALQGLKVLAVDLDPQASLSSLLGVQVQLLHFDEDMKGSSLCSALVFSEDRVPASELVQKTYFNNLDLIPGHPELQDYEYLVPSRMLAGKMSEEDFFFNRVKFVLQDVVENYDVIILDTSPNLGYLTMGAMQAATGLLLCIHPAMLDTSSLANYLATVSGMRTAMHDSGAQQPDYDFVKFLVTNHNPQDQSQAAIAAMFRTLFGDRVLHNVVLESTALAKAGLRKQTLYEVSPADVAREVLKRARDSFDSVNGEILDMIKGAWGR
ncbi:plasmid partitioning protein RepA [Pseudovibrio ascidiaceicola]|uniref:plasmid partitioning protein RepA n=1 Tax=Pseudovibrio ascidiaceicola TaxID=285279 RepID=UPI003D35DDF6